MTDGGYVSTTPPIKHDEEKPSIGNLIAKRLTPVAIALLVIAIMFMLPIVFIRSECVTEEDIKVMVLDKTEYSYAEAKCDNSDGYYYFNPNAAETELSVLIEYNGEQYMVHNILLHSKAKVGEYFDAVLVTDHYSDGSIMQRIKFDLGGDHEEDEQ